MLSPAVEDEKPEPLHAYQVTADDAAFLRKAKGKRFADNAVVALPSGKQISGAEMNRWV